MRASPPRRSLVWLAAPALFVAACAPLHSTDNRPPPCAPGTELCHPTGICVPPEALEDVCPYGLDLRQGGTVVAPAPAVTDPKDVTASSSWPDFETAVKTAPDGSVFVEVTAPHGSLLGDTAPNGPYLLHISTTLGGIKTERDIRLIVSPIAVSTEGDDAAPGTGAQPFRTLKRAAEFARLGDTISLLLTDKGVFFDSNNATEILIHDGVIVEGQTPIARDKNQSTPAQIPTAKMPDPPRPTQPPFLDMPLRIEGQLTISNVQLGRRLVLEAPDRMVTLQTVGALAGITVEASASRMILFVNGGSILTSGNDPVNPLLIEADDVNVRLSLGAHVTYNDPPKVQAVLSTGNKTTLQVYDNSGINTTLAPVAIRLEGEDSALELDGRTTDQDRNVYIQGKVELVAPTTTASIKHARFQLANDVGGVMFQGNAMTVEDSDFFLEGITQTAPRSTVTVRRTTFNYRRVGYNLKSGRLDLGTKLDPGGNAFSRAQQADSSSMALLIDAPVDGWNSVWSSKTTFDAVEPREGTVQGPLKSPDGIYDISTGVTIDFYDVAVP